MNIFKIFNILHFIVCIQLQAYITSLVAIKSLLDGYVIKLRNLLFFLQIEKTQYKKMKLFTVFEFSVCLFLAVVEAKSKFY